jgi:hypothetical protein
MCSYYLNVFVSSEYLIVFITDAIYMSNYVMSTGLFTLTGLLKSRHPPGAHLTLSPNLKSVVMHF